MSLWTKKQILDAVKGTDVAPPRLAILPLLSDSQIGQVSIDIRLGYDFLVSVLNRQPAIQIKVGAGAQLHRLPGHFQETRREIGDTFILYPNQLVLGTTIEYFAMPNDVYAEIGPRSSYSRLGLSVNTIIQPGFRGCVPLELLNHGNVPVELTVGARVCQARFHQMDESVDYHGEASDRKYYGQVRPAVSKAGSDEELSILAEMPRVIRAPGYPDSEE
ncbi:MULTISPECIES: dCTP deaminase [Burkholderia]|uniref:dCTP deaminase n=1 Tax=Burkholderia TaxID=32008 RepID=UPI0009B4BB80|nr:MULTISPECIES: dCTP deaminase [Burkholderia]VBP13350.1 deoxycytidine triphosphate deaminase [Burkholderia pseudomallei]